jgi:hypothetical protein
MSRPPVRGAVMLRVDVGWLKGVSCVGEEGIERLVAMLARHRMIMAAVRMRLGVWCLGLAMCV